eukprot:jgi/Tetstr1/450132/TSEL_037174.t1
MRPGQFRGMRTRLVGAKGRQYTIFYYRFRSPRTQLVGAVMPSLHHAPRLPQAQTGRLCTKTLRLAETGNLPLCRVTDGTHKIHYGKWVLLTLGTHPVEYDMEKYNLVHSFRPISFRFAQEEDGAAMTIMFKTMMDTHKNMYGSSPNGLRNPTDSLMEKHFLKWLEDETYMRSNKYINHAFGMELSTDVQTTRFSGPTVLKYRNNLAGNVGSRPRWTIHAIERDFMFMNRVTLHNGRPICDCERL